MPLGDRREQTRSHDQEAKWAFKNKADAEKFIMLNGGTLATFDEAMKAAYESMYADTKMIRDKRKKMREMKKMKMNKPSCFEP